MSFESWFGLVGGTIGSIATVVSCFYAHKTHKKDQQLAQKSKLAEWSLTRTDYDEWLLERKGSGQVKVYGYSMDQFIQPYNSIPHKFNNPQVFVEGSKWGIMEELKGDNWDLTLYFTDVDHVEETDSQMFPKDANKWVHPLT